MFDPTEDARKEMIADINSSPVVRAGEGQTWTTDELRRDFDVIEFLAPFVYVRRKADGVKGTLKFRHSPRVYFEFEKE